MIGLRAAVGGLNRVHLPAWHIAIAEAGMLIDGTPSHVCSFARRGNWAMSGS